MCLSGAKVADMSVGKVNTASKTKDKKLNVLLAPLGCFVKSYVFIASQSGDTRRDPPTEATGCVRLSRNST